MARKKIIIISIAILLFIAVYLPGFSRLQRLKDENKDLERKISELKVKNDQLKEEVYRLETDPTYVESVAREKLKKTKEGEIIYKID